MTTPQENFGAWLNEHYYVPSEDHEGPDIRCRRCGAQVNWPTKHAVERHRDRIDVMPPTNQRVGDLVY